VPYDLVVPYDRLVGHPFMGCRVTKPGEDRRGAFLGPMRLRRLAGLRGSRLKSATHVKSGDPRQ
jgi:hypothetical protein